jgi:hypothetical protein
LLPQMRRSVHFSAATIQRLHSGRLERIASPGAKTGAPCRYFTHLCGGRCMLTMLSLSINVHWSRALCFVSYATNDSSGVAASTRCTSVAKTPKIDSDSGGVLLRCSNCTNSDFDSSAYKYPVNLDIYQHDTRLVGLPVDAGLYSSGLGV